MNGYKAEKHPVTENNLRYAIEEWAGDASELLLCMADHGKEGLFQLNRADDLKAENLHSYLNELQNTMPGRVILVYDACRSGSFISPQLPLPEGKERILITSSDKHNNAFFLKKGRLSFSFQFWSSVYGGARLNTAFSFAEEMMDPYQTALADADGDGIMEDADLKLLGSIVIGEGNGTALILSYIEEVCCDKTT